MRHRAISARGTRAAECAKDELSGAHRPRRATRVTLVTSRGKLVKKKRYIRCCSEYPFPVRDPRIIPAIFNSRGLKRRRYFEGGEKTVASRLGFWRDTKGRRLTVPRCIVSPSVRRSSHGPAGGKERKALNFQRGRSRGQEICFKWR